MEIQEERFRLDRRRHLRYLDNHLLEIISTDHRNGEIVSVMRFNLTRNEMWLKGSQPDLATIVETRYDNDGKVASRQKHQCRVEISTQDNKKIHSFSSDTFIKRVHLNQSGEVDFLEMEDEEELMTSVPSESSVRKMMTLTKKFSTRGFLKIVLATQVITMGMAFVIGIMSGQSNQIPLKVFLAFLLVLILALGHGILILHTRASKQF